MMDRTHEQLSLPAPRRIVEFTLPEMANRRSADRVSALLSQIVGIQAVETDALRHKARVAFDPRVTDLGALTTVIEGGGCAVADVSQRGAHRASLVLCLIVPGMSCEHFADVLARSIQRLPGVMIVTVDLAIRRVSVRFDPSKAEADMIEAAVERAGFDIAESSNGPDASPPSANGTVKPLARPTQPPAARPMEYVGEPHV